jgi:cytochrome c peroxidase
LREADTPHEILESAKTLDDAVEFYNQRFQLGFTDQQKKDLVAFLKTL